VRIRILADYLAQMEPKSGPHRADALEIYRRLLDLKDNKHPRARRPAVLHNYATLLFSRGFAEEAGRLWSVAYALQRDDHHIRRGYSGYLNNAGRVDLARRVAAGEPLEEEILIPSTAPPPPQFTTTEYIDEAFRLIDKLPGEPARGETPGDLD
jgi:hypothetical protein